MSLLPTRLSVILNALALVVLPSVGAFLLPPTVAQRALLERIVGPLPLAVLPLIITGLIRIVVLVARSRRPAVSWTYALTSALLVGTGFYLLLWLLSIGQPLTLGLAEAAVVTTQATYKFAVDLRPFAFLGIAVTLAKIADATWRVRRAQAQGSLASSRRPS